MVGVWASVELVEAFGDNHQRENHFHDTLNDPSSTPSSEANTLEANEERLDGVLIKASPPSSSLSAFFLLGLRAPYYLMAPSEKVQGDNGKRCVLT